MLTSHRQKVIANDFSAELWAHDGNRALFGARRGDLWHFVRSDYEQKSGVATNAITQCHISRYEIASDVAGLLLANSQRPRGRKAPICVSESGLFIRSEGRFDIGVMMTQNGLAKKFSASLKEDVPIIERAKERVVEKNDLFSLPRAKSFKKNPVAAASRELIEAIAFEKELRGRLDARRFGIYSAFCTWRDFHVGTGVSAEEIAEHVSAQFSYDPENIPAEFVDLTMRVQDRLFAAPIWGIGIELDFDRAVKILRATMESLNSVQRAQFALMNGMHEAGLFLPLAVVSNLIAFSQYTDWMTERFEPDSEEEQRIRTEVVFIELLGKLISNPADVSKASQFESGL